MAGGSKLVSRLAQAPKIRRDILILKKLALCWLTVIWGMLARESYGATKDFFTSRLGNLWDDFSRKKFAFAGLDDFRYGDDIGKHTARLYQSTSEGAEYQRISRGLYSEAGEVGRDLGKSQTRNWIDEANEILTDGSHMVEKFLNLMWYMRLENIAIFTVLMRWVVSIGAYAEDLTKTP